MSQFNDINVIRLLKESRKEELLDISKGVVVVKGSQYYMKKFRLRSINVTLTAPDGIKAMSRHTKKQKYGPYNYPAFAYWDMRDEINIALEIKETSANVKEYAKNTISSMLNEGTGWQLKEETAKDVEIRFCFCYQKAAQLIFFRKHPKGILAGSFTARSDPACQWEAIFQQMLDSLKIVTERVIA